MANVIKFKRGTEGTLPTLEAGEPAFTTDTHKLYVGDGTTNHQIGGDIINRKLNTSLTIGSYEQLLVFGEYIMDTYGVLTIESNGELVIM